MSLTNLHSAIDSGIAQFGQSEVRSTIGAELKHTTRDHTGRSFLLGSTVLAEGVNFSVFSRKASRVELLLFDDAAAVQPARVIALDAHTNRTYYYWHVFVSNIGPGQVYAYRASGPFDPTLRLRFAVRSRISW